MCLRPLRSGFKSTNLASPQNVVTFSVLTLPAFLPHCLQAPTDLGAFTNAVCLRGELTPDLLSLSLHVKTLFDLVSDRTQVYNRVPGPIPVLASEGVTWHL